MWGWANENVDPPLAVSVRQLGASHGGVPEFAQPRFAMPREIDGYALAIVATGLAGADAYYRAPHPGGSVFVMLRMPADTPLPDWSPLRRAVATLRAAPLTHIGPVGAEDVIAYLRGLGLEPLVTEAAISVRQPEGELVVRADAAGRMTSIESDTWVT